MGNRRTTIQQTQQDNEIYFDYNTFGNDQIDFRTIKFGKRYLDNTLDP